MKKIIYFITFLLLLVSCSKDDIIQDPISEKYKKALDTLINYDNYFIGEVNGELLISVQHFSYGGSVGNTLQDSVVVDFFYSYKIANSEYLKTPFLYFQVYESINELNPNTFNYKEYKDFYSFFKRDEFRYLRYLDKGKNLTPEVSIRYLDYSQLINNTGKSYNSTDIDNPPLNGNNFYVESLKKVEIPNKGIELIYSFNCTLFSDSNELIEIKNAKGKLFLPY